MQITRGIGVAIGLGAAAAAAVGIGIAIGTRDRDPGGQLKLPNPEPGPAPTPRLEAGQRVDDVASRYLQLYDKSGDGSIDISRGQKFSADERITGEIGSIHTMIEFFQQADTDGSQLVTRDELRGAIAAYDTSGTIGFNPKMPEFGDGFLGQRELASFHDGAIGAYSDPVEQLDDRGVAQIITVDGKRRNNEGFFRELPEFRGYS